MTRLAIRRAERLVHRREHDRRAGSAPGLERLNDVANAHCAHSLTDLTRWRRLNMPAPPIGCTTPRGHRRLRGLEAAASVRCQPWTSREHTQIESKRAAASNPSASKPTAKRGSRRSHAAALGRRRSRPRRPARHAQARRRAYRDWFSGYRDDPVEYLRRTFEEVDGYDEMIVLRDISSNRTASTTWRRSSAARTSAICRPQGRRHQQARARRRGVRAPAAGAGKADRADRALHPRRAQAARRRRRHRRRAPVHDDARRAQARRVDDHEPDARHFRKDPRTRAEFLTMIGRPAAAS